MAQPSIEERFHGTCNLAILHLRRAAKSNDLEAGFAAARDMGMIDAAQERFVRECLAADGRLQAGEAPGANINLQLVKHLQACILSLNTADPA